MAHTAVIRLKAWKMAEQPWQAFRLGAPMDPMGTDDQHVEELK